MHRKLYLTMAGIILFGAGLFTGGALDAYAEETHRPKVVVYPISWWRAHPDSIRAVMPRCHDDVQAARSANCINAEAAAAGLHAPPVDLAGMLQQPAYWSSMPLAREAFLSQCRNGTALVPAACHAAAQSALAEMSRR